MPYYVYENFKNACGSDKSNIMIFKAAEDNAKSQFNLYPKSVLLEFINNDGLEDLEFKNTKEWEKNPDSKHKIMVDAYEFRTSNRLGYIAFMYNSVTKKWIIKSFKISENSNPAMYLAMEKAGLFLEEKNEQ